MPSSSKTVNVSPFSSQKENIKPEIRKDVSRYTFIHGNLRSLDLLTYVFKTNAITHVVHFAAQSHVQTSFTDALTYTQDNVVGTHNLLETVRLHCPTLEKFIHVSTDEVFGSLSVNDPASSEDSLYKPNSPYSASKASSGHIVRAYNKTYDIKTTVTNCSNNYGPFQYPEKIIPFFILKLMKGEKVPVYGNGLNSRDWLHVSDHCQAIHLVLTKGTPGEIYNIGGGRELTNIELTHKILKAMNVGEEFIQPVEDRKGHDLRYSVDISKISKELGYKPEVDFDKGLQETINWYKNNESWEQDAIIIEVLPITIRIWFDDGSW